MKLRKKAAITRDPEIPWFVQLRCPYQEEFAAALSSEKYPGAQYLRNSKAWLWPIEGVPLLVQLAQEHGFDVKLDLGPEPKDPKALPPSLR